MKRYRRQFGGKVTRSIEAQYAKSTHWQEGNFQNIEPTSLGGGLLDFPRMIYKQLSERGHRVPKQPLPIKPFDASGFVNAQKQARFAWYGHSALLMIMEGKTMLIDPMLGPDTTPIAPMATKRFSEHTLQLIDDFPEIDLMLITHDHYDHLDLASIDRLKSKTKAFYVALGVKRHLVAWGIDEERIFEFDWWQSKKLDALTITFTPTRHFSGRGISDRNKTLWGGWVLKSPHENIWFSGDGGYGRHFKEIGERLGPFDFAFMECGQYNDDWHLIHLFPQEAVKAALDAKVKKAMPVHWGGFPLSYQHTWQEPADEFVASAQKYQLPYAVPPLGEIISVSDEITEPWWKKFK
ncbi:MAG: MBL fold metallo-hydrolase [Flavobacteriaceae bacterium]|nr:MBL fold metallo-hydrolase [Flavobacteriaceae bacterium]